MTARGGFGRAAALFVLAALAGCRAHGSPPAGGSGGADGAGTTDPSACEAERPEPSSLSRVAEMEGAWRLTLVATSGPAAGEAVSGLLRLAPTDSSGAPLRGWTDAPVGKLGATVPGDAASTDPEAPGVLVLVGPVPPGPEGPAPVTLRLGSHANRGDVILFDGSYAALYVRAISGGGFRGEWSSGVTKPDVEGRFCAVREDGAGAGTP